MLENAKAGTSTAVSILLCDYGKLYQRPPFSPAADVAVPEIAFDTQPLLGLTQYEDKRIGWYSISSVLRHVSFIMMH